MDDYKGVPSNANKKTNNYNEMKTPKINSTQTLVIIPLLILLLTNACAQPGNKSKSDTSTPAKSVVAKPKTDIHAAVLSGNLEVVQQHIEAKTDINGKDAMSGSTPFDFCSLFWEKRDC